MTFSLESRQQAIQNLKNEQLDLLIIGGGSLVQGSPFNLPHLVLKRV